MTICYLENYIDTLESVNDKKKALNALINAANDWPIAITDLYDFEENIKTFLNATPSKETISIWLNNHNYTDNLWQAESLSQVLEVYEFFDASLSLKTIITNVEKDALPNLS